MDMSSTDEGLVIVIVLHATTRLDREEQVCLGGLRRLAAACGGLRRLAAGCVARAAINSCPLEF